MRQATTRTPLIKLEKVMRVRALVRRWPIVSGVVIIVLALVAILAPVISPQDPLEHSLLDRNTPPIWYSEGSWNHILGADTLGRDVLSRLIHGARVSLTVAAISLASGTLIGTSLGLWAGYSGGLVDELITRVVDIWLGLPFVLVALIIALVVGNSLTTMAVLLALLAWTPFVRQVRGEVLSLKEREYVQLAKVAGASTTRILLKHLLPGVIGTVMVIATFRIGQLILVESFLSFLGAGIPFPHPAWGSMIAEGRDYLHDAWWISFFPGLAIFLTVSSMSFFGDWIRDFFDPRLRQKAL